MLRLGWFGSSGLLGFTVCFRGFMVGEVAGWFGFLVLLLEFFVNFGGGGSLGVFGLIFLGFSYPLHNLQKQSTPASLGE